MAQERPIAEERRAQNQKLIEEFRANGGVPDDRPLLLLTTTGARTGKERTTPMMFVPDGERLLVIASNAGAPRDPDWFHNLVAYPEVRVEVTGDTFDATASVLLDEERDRVFAEIVRLYPFFAEHQSKITREIPVIALTRR
jgi:deazaflavin-dependent oxidoreductase (nitroreductase family)